MSTQDTSSVRLLTATLDGKRVAYHSDTVFRVQVGRGRGGYRDRYRIVGNLGQAVAYFNALNIRAPFKKRLRCDTMNKPTLARLIGGHA